MALSFVGIGAVANFAGATGVTVAVPAGVAVNDQLIVVFGFEAVDAGSGPWVTSAVQAGWSRAFYQPPSDTGSGLEVWHALWTSGPITNFNFASSSTGIAREAAFRCPSGAGAILDAFASAQHTGDNPVAPAVTTIVADTLVVPVVAFEVQSPGLTQPAPYTERFDNARVGTFGNVEIELASANQAVAGPSGTIAYTATAETGTTKGATGTLAYSCDRRSVLLPILHVGP